MTWMRARFIIRQTHICEIWWRGQRDCHRFCSDAALTSIAGQNVETNNVFHHQPFQLEYSFCQWLITASIDTGSIGFFQQFIDIVSSDMCNVFRALVVHVCDMRLIDR